MSEALIENELKFSIMILKIKTKMGRPRAVYPKSTLGLINWDLNDFNVSLIQTIGNIYFRFEFGLELDNTPNSGRC